MLQHADGRLSVFMHLTRIVIALDQWVPQGAVIGFVSRNPANLANLHFYIQPNAVQRTCLMPDGLDEIHYDTMRVVSYNLPWQPASLNNPFRAAIENMPPVRISERNVTVVLPITVAPESDFRVSVLLTGTVANISSMGVVLGGPEDVWWTSPISHTTEGVLFRVPVKATSRLGINRWTLNTGEALATHVFTLVFTVAEPISLSVANGIILANPELVSPTSYSIFDQSPSLCWRMTSREVISEFRVIVAGPSIADSGWLSDLPNEACWQPPLLPAGIYRWKVFARDSWGTMNRTHQYPLAFVIR
jgi:hypothetical protein